MSENIQKTRGVVKNYKDDRGGQNLIPSAVLGIVKNNIDPARCGKIEVYLKRTESGDESNPDNWTPVHYLSPFFGSTPNTSGSTGEGSFKTNPNSYGFWATPPDLGTEVVCVFLNGSIDDGYYIGSIPQVGTTHMVPAIASSDRIVANGAEAENYGGATRLPVGEINNANPEKTNKSFLTEQARPIHSYQAAILNNQGLVRDPDRGTISSSSSRESPSRVFGISTPGRPIYEGGFDDVSIQNAVKDEAIPDKKFKVVGRRGGHTLVMDDGTLGGKDQLVRIRTASGHMIMMNDSAQTLFIVHSNGQSYIELGKEGTIDMFSTNSVNIRTQGDLNLHSDNDININATKNLNIFAENIKTESSKETTSFVGTTFQQHTQGDHTVKVDSKMSFASKGDASLFSDGPAFVNGSKVNLNTGSSSLVPEKVKQLTQTAHSDTLYDTKKGYIAAPGKLQSITSRAPAHSPWTGANQGVNVKTNASADANLPASPSAELQAVNKAADNAPTQSTTPALAATAPTIQPASKQLDQSTTSAMASQLAVNASTGVTSDAVSKMAGVVDLGGAKLPSVGVFAMNANQMENAGTLKPGSATLVNAAVAAGKPIEQAMTRGLFTGKDGISSVSDFAKNIPAQANALSTVFGKAESALKDAGAITGKESPTQTAGLVMSAATVGATQTMGFVQSLGNMPKPTNVQESLSLASGVAGAMGLKLPASLSGSMGSAKDMISSGKFAADMSDKSLGALSSLPISDQLKGVAAGAFNKIKEGFKTLKSGVPVNLTEEKAKAQEAMNAEDKPAAPAAIEAPKPSMPSVAEVKSALNAAASGLSNLPGGGAAVGSVISLANKAVGFAGAVSSIAEKFESAKSTGTSVPGLDKISGSLSSISASVQSGGVSSSLNDLKSKLSSGADNLKSLAGSGLPAGELAKLNGAINSLGAGGPVPVKLPTSASDTFDLGPMLGQAKALLGDSKIPELNFSGLPAGAFKIPTAEEAKEYDRVQAEIDKETDNFWDLNKKYLDIKMEKGPDASETVAAYTALQDNQKKLATLRQSLGKTST